MLTDKHEIDPIVMIPIDNKTHQRLKEGAMRQGISVGSYLRKIIIENAEKYEKEKIEKPLTN